MASEDLPPSSCLQPDMKEKKVGPQIPRRSSRSFARVSRRARASLDHATPGLLRRDLHGRAACIAAGIFAARRRILRKSPRKTTQKFYGFSRLSVCIVKIQTRAIASMRVAHCTTSGQIDARDTSPLTRRTSAPELFFALIHRKTARNF